MQEAYQSSCAIHKGQEDNPLSVGSQAVPCDAASPQTTTEKSGVNNGEGITEGTSGWPFASPPVSLQAAFMENWKGGHFIWIQKMLSLHQTMPVPHSLMPNTSGSLQCMLASVLVHLDTAVSVS